MTKKRKPSVVKGFALKEHNRYLLISTQAGLLAVPQIPKGYHLISQKDYDRYSLLFKLTGASHAYNYLVHTYILKAT